MERVKIHILTLARPEESGQCLHRKSGDRSKSVDQTTVLRAFESIKVARPSGRRDRGSATMTATAVFCHSAGFFQTFQLPYYCAYNQRAIFANGANANNMKNVFHGQVTGVSGN
jgi:hypothetical protein